MVSDLGLKVIACKFDSHWVSYTSYLMSQQRLVNNWWIIKTFLNTWCIKCFLKYWNIIFFRY